MWDDADAADATHIAAQAKAFAARRKVADLLRSRYMLRVRRTVFA
jgi:hypothetical protein